MSLISLNSVSFRYGDKIILDKADFNIEEGDSIALVGNNGAGKTTLLRLMADLEVPDSGLVQRANGIKVAYMRQDVPVDLSGSLYDAIVAGFGENGRLLSDYHRLAAEVDSGRADALAQKKLDDAIHAIERRSAWDIDLKTSEIVRKLELPEVDDVSALSAGLKRRVLIGRELVSSPDIIMLDEPTNHLDIDSVVWLENFLKTCGKTLVFVSHDRMFLDNVATRVAEVDRGKLISFQCGFSEFTARRDEYLEAVARDEAAFDKKLAKEEAWLRRGVRARRTRNEGRVRELMKLRKIRSARMSRAGDVNLSLQTAERTGQKVFDVKNLTVSFGGTPVIDDFSTTIYRGDRIGIVGRNGAGKTTLLNAILGKIKPTAGEVSFGTGLEVAYFDQLREGLNPHETPIEYVTGDGSDFVSVNGSHQNVLGYLQNFLFTPAQAMGEISMLSGGEKNRLALARLFSRPANVLVLDEPTNDLDMRTIELLENLVDEFSGTVLLVSHDRSFLNDIVTGVFCFAEGGKLVELAGGYDEWEAYRTKLAEADSVRAKKNLPAKVPSEVCRAKKPRKLSSKEKEELESLPQKIAEVEERQGGIQNKMQDANFAKNNASEFFVLNAELEALAATEEKLFARWEELESVRAAFESAS